MEYTLSISFKPCYKWNTFNIELESLQEIKLRNQVLNLVMSGLPSKLKHIGFFEYDKSKF